MVRQNRGAEESAEGTRIEAPLPGRSHPSRLGSLGERRKLPQRGLGILLANFVHFISYFMHSDA